MEKKLFEIAFPELYKKFTERIKEQFPELNIYLCDVDERNPNTLFPLFSLNSMQMEREIYVNDVTNLELSFDIALADRVPERDVPESTERMLKLFGRFVDKFDTHKYDIEIEGVPARLRGDLTGRGSNFRFNQDDTYVIISNFFTYSFQSIKY